MRHTCQTHLSVRHTYDSEASYQLVTGFNETHPQFMHLCRYKMPISWLSIRHTCQRYTPINLTHLSIKTHQSI